MIVDPPLDFVGQPVQHRAAFVGRQRGPARLVERLLRRGDRGVDVAVAEMRNGRQLLARARIVRFKCRAVGRIRLLAADPRLLQRTCPETCQPREAIRPSL